MKVNFAFHLEVKVPESGERVERHRIQVAWSPVWSFHSQWWFGLPCHLLVVVHCFLKSTVNAAIYQEIFEHFMLPSAEKLYGDADFISSSTWHYFSSFNHAVIIARDWFVQDKKNKPMHGSGERSSGYAARKNGRGVWLYNQLPATLSQISSLQRRTPFFPEVHYKLTKSWHAPYSSRLPSFCFSCSHIRWRRWRKRIWAPASSGWVCGCTSLSDGRQGPAIRPSRVKPLLYSLDAPTWWLDKRLQCFTQWLCSRSSRPRCSPMRKPVWIQPL